MYSRHFCTLPRCSYELLFSAGLWLEGCGRQMSTRLFRILHCALRWGLEAELQEKEVERGVLQFGSLVDPCKAGREGLCITFIGCSSNKGEKQHHLKPPSCMQLEQSCSLGPGLVPLSWPGYVRNGCNTSGCWALGTLNCCLCGNEIMSCLFLHNSLPEAGMHQGWANKLRSDSDMSGISQSLLPV